jgi:hypothetical protein
MKFVSKFAVAAVAAYSFAGVASANAVINNWVFNPTGGGFAGGQIINEYLDVNGNAFIQLTPTSASTFNFVEHAVFNITQADSNGQLFPLNFAGGNISATFEAYGSGNFSGAFTFTGGKITMYHNPTNGQYGTTAGIYGANLGTVIASFDVLAGGGGDVDGSGSPTNNGQISVNAKASTPGGLKAGYFFRGNGSDLANEDILSFAFTNANTVGAPTSRLVSEVACQYAAYAGPGCAGGTYKNVAGSHFFVSNNGQFKLASEVPEPGSLALLGLAMLGAGVVSRKRKQA